jgi:sec-independent protein translocase protein TatC
MSEGDPDDRDDDRRHDPGSDDDGDQSPAEERPEESGDRDGPADESDEPAASEDPHDEGSEPVGGDNSADESGEPASDDGPAEKDGHPDESQPTQEESDVPSHGRAEREQMDFEDVAFDSGAETDIESSEDDVDSPDEDDGSTDDPGDSADSGETAPDDEPDDVPISGGAAAPEPDGPEPVSSAHSGAPDDQEMPLTEHIEEMIRRLLVVIVVMAIVSAVIFPFADRLINFLWYSFLPGQPTECVQAASAAATNASNGTAANGTVGSSEAACPRLYHPLALVLARLKVASLSGFIIALPVFVYETYLFMRPGLYPNERRYYLASVPTSLILAAIGVLFAYLAVLPLIFTYFLGYSQPVANVAFGLSETFGLILLMLGMFAAIFQIPLFIMLAIMMGVTSRRWLVQRRLYFWFGFAGFAFLFSPDPTGMAPFIVALTMVGLFEATLLLLRWTGR